MNWKQTWDLGSHMQKMESHIRKVPGSLLIMSEGYHLSMWNLLEENRTLLCVRTWSLLGLVCYITPMFHRLWQLWQSDWPLVEEELFAFFPFWWVKVHLLPASRMNQHMALEITLKLSSFFAYLPAHEDLHILPISFYQPLPPTLGLFGVM